MPEAYILGQDTDDATFFLTFASRGAQEMFLIYRDICLISVVLTTKGELRFQDACKTLDLGPKAPYMLHATLPLCVVELSVGAKPTPVSNSLPLILAVSIARWATSRSDCACGKRCVLSYMLHDM
jgi:hypothetical protein